MLPYSARTFLGLIVALCTAVVVMAGSEAETDYTYRAVVPQVAADDPDLLRMNEVQVVGTHNSYHQQLRPAAFALLQQFSPQYAMEWEFTHASLAAQLQAGIRQIEIDAFADPAGGLYANPLGLRLIGEDLAPGIPELMAPGFKVLHAQDIDFETTCPTFVACLADVRDWSVANPSHLPVVILVEAKDDPLDVDPSYGTVIPVPIGTTELEALEAEVLSVFERSSLIVPDDVRRGADTLEAGVLQSGWPALSEARGKVMFVLINRELRDAYLAGHPALAGRLMFTSSVPGEPDAAFRIIDDPVAGQAEIQAAVAAGYLVRTRADSNTAEARTGDTVRRDAAIASGAQFISTDYPWYGPASWTGYSVSLPGGVPARCIAAVEPGAGHCLPSTVIP